MLKKTTYWAKIADFLTRREQFWIYELEKGSISFMIL
jgi:hypothetical protein